MFGQRLTELKARLHNATGNDRLVIIGEINALLLSVREQRGTRSAEPTQTAPQIKETIPGPTPAPRIEEGNDHDRSTHRGGQRPRPPHASRAIGGDNRLKVGVERFVQKTQADPPHVLTSWLSPLATALHNPLPDVVQESTEDTPPAFVPMFSEIAGGIKREGKAAVGLVWTIVHHKVNRLNGKQHATEAEIIDLLTNDDDFAIYKCGRRWRSTRHEGQGVFWEKLPDGRYFIYGVAEVADRLNLPSIGRRVGLALSDLKPKTFRRALYSTFVAAREGKPTSRRAIKDSTGTSRAQQWRYDKAAGNSAETHIVLLDTWSSEAEQNEHFERDDSHSTPVFKFVDHQGKQGKQGASYVAARLPDTRQTQLKKLPKGRKNKINQKLKSRVDIQGAGTDDVMIDKQQFFNDPIAAHRGGGVYRGGITARNGAVFWYRA